MLDAGVRINAAEEKTADDQASTLKKCFRKHDVCRWKIDDAEGQPSSHLVCKVRTVS